MSTTTHKTLQKPQNNMIMYHKKHQKHIDHTIFPNLQKKPHNHTTTKITITLKKTTTNSFQTYKHQIITNTKTITTQLLHHNFNLITKNTNNHLILFDTTNHKTTNKKLATTITRTQLITNTNTIPFDPQKPFNPNNVHLNTPTITNHNMKETKIKHITNWITTSLKTKNNPNTLQHITNKITTLCSDYTPPKLNILEN